jgi:hypothetical protein
VLISVALPGPLVVTSVVLPQSSQLAVVSLSMAFNNSSNVYALGSNITHVGRDQINYHSVQSGRSGMKFVGHVD